MNETTGVDSKAAPTNALDPVEGSDLMLSIRAYCETLRASLATVTKERDILRVGHQNLIDERTSRIEAEARAHESVRVVEAELDSAKHLCNTEYERGVTVGQELAHAEMARLTALLAQQDTLKAALVEALIPLEALHAAARWELADEVKASIGHAVKIGRAALLPPPPRAEGGRQEEKHEEPLTREDTTEMSANPSVPHRKKG